jgi:hypothetical protein
VMKRFDNSLDTLGDRQLSLSSLARYRERCSMRFVNGAPDVSYTSNAYEFGAKRNRSLLLRRRLLDVVRPRVPFFRIEDFSGKNLTWVFPFLVKIPGQIKMQRLQPHLRLSSQGILI